MYYIYFLLESDTHIPFYVGQTNNTDKRYKRHIYDTKRKKPNYYVHRKIRKLWREGRDLDIKVIKRCSTIKEIDEQEIFYINKLRKEGYKICNTAFGGVGFRATPEMQKRAGEKRRGQKLSAETRKRMSEARMGMKFSKKHKKNLSKARKKRITKPETGLKISRTNKGRINIHKYKMIDSDGNVFFTEKGLSDFCRQNDLTPSNMIKVANGERKRHKGWSCQRLF